LIGAWLERENRAINEAAINVLGAIEGAAVLEIGCGPGWALARLAAAGASSLAAVDPSPGMVRRARRRSAQLRAMQRAGTLDVRNASAEILPFAARTFDAAIAVNSVYFWKPASAALLELRRVARPGGRVVIALEDADALARLGATPETGFSSFTPAALCALCEAAGFVDVTALASDGGFCVRAVAPRD
jgi:SAM-dependent methyltransferase